MSKRSAEKRVQQRQRTVGPTPLGGGYTYCDLLSLPPPTTSLAASVPRPRGATLRAGLPLWNSKPLNTKLPLIPGPRGPVVFTRAKLGEKLWKSPPSREFQLGDDAGLRFDYEAAHDRHLRSWLRQPNTVATLRRHGLVTDPPSLRVTCSVDQYNAYRQYLYSLYRDALRAEACHREALAMQSLMVKKAREHSEKEAARLRKLEESDAKRVSNLQRIQHLNLERLEKCKKRLQRVIDRAKRAEERKEVEEMERKQRMEAFDDRIKSRVNAANNLERRNKIKALRARYKLNQRKKRQFEKCKQERELENKEKAEARWKRKVKEQKKQIAKEKYLREQKALYKQTFQQQYMKIMEKEWMKLEDELNLRKCRGTLDRVKYENRKKSTKQIMDSVSEAYRKEKKSVDRLSQDGETIDTLTEHIQQTLREIRYDLEPYVVIAHARHRLERQENVPLPVSGAIKFLLEQSVIEYTADQLSQTMTIAAKKVLTAIDELNEEAIADVQTPSMKCSSISSAFPTRMSTASQKTAKICEIEVIPLVKDSDEFVTEIENLLSTRDRPPTPMPSIATLTESLFKDTAKEEFEDVYYGDNSFTEQDKLKIRIAQISNRIYKMIPIRVKSVVRSRSYDRISSITTSDIGSTTLPESKPVAKLCSLILFEESVQDHVLEKIVDRIILKFMQDINLTPSYLRLKMKHRLEAVR